MAENQTEVIRYLRKKSSEGFTEPITYLGAEQRFVNALRNSGVNNLEEQYIIGTDTYTESYLDDDGNSVVEKSFHINDAAHSITDYYKLVTVTYKDGQENKDFYFDENQVSLPNDKKEVTYGTGDDPYEDKSELYCVNGKTFVREGSNLKIYPSTYTLIRTEDLYYIKDNGDTVIHVSQKSVGKRYTDNGTKEVIRESIKNYLVNPESD